jgi:predicted phosphodiesterase
MTASATSRPRRVARAIARGWRRGRRPLAAVLALVVLAIAGIVLGLRLAGPATYTTPLGDLRIAVEPALQGRIDAYVPLADWGVRARAFEGPLELRAEIRSIARNGVLKAATGDREVLERTRASLDDVAAQALLRALVAALAGALAIGLVAALAILATGRRSPRLVGGTVAGTVVAAAVIVGGGGVLARATFDAAAALERPSFYARGAELLQLLEAATKTQDRAARYTATAENGVRSFSRLLAEGGTAAGGFLADTSNDRSAILASDLHNNTLAVDSLEALAGGDRAVFFAGDFGHQGLEGEARLVAPRLADLGPRVIAVSGNHDSALLMRRLADTGVTVLTGRGRLRPDGSVLGPPVIDVMGLKVAGAADPLEWQGSNPGDPERILSFSERDDGDREFDAAVARLVTWFDGLPERPDVLLIHNTYMAADFARILQRRGTQPRLLVLSGHDHKQHVTRFGDVVVVDAGTVGAGGVLGVGSQKVGLGELHFSEGSGLRSVDLIQAEPLSGGAQAERVIVEGRRCDEEPVECKLSG